MTQRQQILVAIAAFLFGVIVLLLASRIALGSQGIASWMPESFGADYLALPEGPGQQVTICGVRCLDMTSTDAGPSKAMQRAGRVADIGVVRWEYICGLPRSAGLCPVNVDYHRTATIPPTDVNDAITHRHGLWFVL